LNRLVSILTLGLASWRLARMLVHEIGPFRLFTEIRKLNGIEHDVDGFPEVTNYDQVLSCIFCTSVWTSIILMLMPKPVVNVLAISAVAAVLEEKYGEGKH
jgi:hypothetical protein